ncbi:MAG TPA: low molecular weight phosphatase family protein [Actinomycetota bacterium]|nr:low molecular weight phosphatase family protein [Actinomycetota bacterium]
MFRTAASKKQVDVRLPSGQSDDTPLVLFVCVHNAGRSRMAEAIFNSLAAGRYSGRSAGTEPADRPHPEVVEVMSETGYEIDDGPGTLLTPELANSATRVIGMGCAVEEACPALSVPLEDWELDDPKGKSHDEVEMIRDQIEMRVRNLIAQLDRANTG